MPVNHEVKSNLAKLLATEDLVVEHRKVSTACFNVHTRVLTLPMWEKASDTVYDLLVSHEVGHALYTPDEDWNTQTKVPTQFVNVTEDARIEKLMKRRYCGLNKTFYKGYNELNDDDFFSICNEDLSKYNLADRANMHFKVGSFVKIPIERSEIHIINMIAEAETFQDALNAAEVLYNYCKQEQKEKVKMPSFDNHQSESSPSSSDSQESFETSDESSGSDSQESVDSGNQESSDSNSKKSSDSENSNFEELDEEPSVETMESFNDAIQDLINTGGCENVYVEVPQLNLDTVIVENSKIHKLCNTHWNSVVSEYKNDCQSSNIIPINLFETIDQEFNQFKQSAQKEVNYLVKEFECRKAADSYARAATSKTGALNTGVLYSYKFNEDLFKKVKTFADGKNHGLIFILDWSGSMQQVLKDTLKQLFNLIWFCKKVSIPFEVYAFTTEWAKVTYDEYKKPIYPKEHYEKKSGLLYVHRDFNLLNVFTSKIKNHDLEDQMRNIYRIAESFNRYSCRYSFPKQLALSGTPLNESLIALHKIIPNFKKNSKVQKIQCVILTDGEASSLPHHQEIKRNFESEIYIGLSRSGSNCILRNRKTGMSYKSLNTHTNFTNALLHDLRDSFVDVNFIGIRIIASRDASHFIHQQSWECYDKLMSEWKKEKSFTITESGYHKYFGLSSSAISSDIEFNVADDATKSTIRNAFKKSLNSKRMNKKFLNEFIKCVA